VRCELGEKQGVCKDCMGKPSGDTRQRSDEILLVSKGPL
jgi:hypothetical protein